jgi:hypothetical protein
MRFIIAPLRKDDMEAPVEEQESGAAGEAKGPSRKVSNPTLSNDWDEYQSRIKGEWTAYAEQTKAYHEGLEDTEKYINELKASVGEAPSLQPDLTAAEKKYEEEEKKGPPKPPAVKPATSSPAAKPQASRYQERRK